MIDETQMTPAQLFELMVDREVKTRDEARAYLVPIFEKGGRGALKRQWSKVFMPSQIQKLIETTARCLEKSGGGSIRELVQLAIDMDIVDEDDSILPDLPAESVVPPIRYRAAAAHDVGRQDASISVETNSPGSSVLYKIVELVPDDEFRVDGRPLFVLRRIDTCEVVSYCDVVVPILPDDGWRTPRVPDDLGKRVQVRDDAACSWQILNRYFSGIVMNDKRSVLYRTTLNGVSATWNCARVRV